MRSAAIAVTCLAGTPSPLPATALGSVILLHVERTVALLGGYRVLLMVITRAWSGQLPNAVSTQGLHHQDVPELADTALREVDRIRAEVATLRKRVERLEEAP